MTPNSLLALSTGVTAVAAANQWLMRRRRSRALRLLAAEWGMNYSPADPLRISPKVARHFPVPGVANVCVRDLIYGAERDRYRYVFTAEFTLGVVRTKRRLSRVASFSEPKERDQTEPAALVTLAPTTGTILERYRHLAPAGVARKPETRGAVAESDALPANPG